jgi:nucleoside phosphorylase/CheY-like chemotaxis protein
MRELKILICEDNQLKANEMLKCINNFFGYGVEVEIAYFLDSSLYKIDEKEYNLIFIDINMKESQHGNYIQLAGLEILEKLNNTYKKDNYECILCTSISSIKDEIKVYLKDYSLLDYTYTQTESDILENEIKKLLIEKSKKLNIDINLKRYDIAVVTALQEEMVEVRNAFNIYEQEIANSNKRASYEWVELTLDNDPHIYKATKIEKINGKSINIVSASAVKMGMSNIAVLATKMIMNFRPKVIVILGICAGKRYDVKLGDILIADRTFDYQAGKVKQINGKEIFYPDPDIHALNSTFLNKFDDKKEVWTNDIASYWKKLTGDKTKIDPNAHIGLIGSGAAVMAKDNTFMDIEEHNRKILGIDMEAFGLFVAAEKTLSHNNPKAVFIKSVQDYADSKKDGDPSSEEKDAFRKYGAFSSAIFFINICHEYLIDYIEQEN